MKLDEQYAARIEALEGVDEEIAHGRGDRLLCELLEELGYEKTASAFKRASNKWWYA